MHDFYYTRLLTDPTKFHPPDNNHILELYETQDGFVECFEDGIDETDVTSWLRNTDEHKNENKPSLRLLIGSSEEHFSDAKILPLPFSRGTFEDIRRVWSLPTELLRMMLSSLPLPVPFTTTASDGQVLQGLMMRGARSRDWNFCLVVVHNAGTRDTVAMVCGMQETEIQMLKECLKQSRNLISDPSLMPVFLLELRVHYFAVLLERRAIGIEEVEYSTGMCHGFSQDPQRNRMIEKESREKLKTLDFHSITQKLTGGTGTLSFCNMTFTSSRRALDLVVAVHTGVRCESALREDAMGPIVALNRRIEYLQELISGSQALCDVLSARTKAQVQTVYSLIGQRDNKINIETALASRQISATGLLHNAAMKKIAEDSRKVAILTRRDSTDMRIIASVTLVFLPGTFVATFFGTNLFQFIPAGSSRVVSKWVWLYWVLTVVITVLVLVSWWLFSRRQMRQTALTNPSQADEKATQSGFDHISLGKQTSDLLSVGFADFGMNRSRSHSTTSAADMNPYGMYFGPTRGREVDGVFSSDNDGSSAFA